MAEWRNVDTHCVTSGCVRRIHGLGDYEVQFDAVAVNPILKDDEAMHWIARLTPTSMTASYKYAFSGREYELCFFRTDESYQTERLTLPCVPLEPCVYRFHGFCVTSNLMAKCALFLRFEVKPGGNLSGEAFECTHQSQMTHWRIVGSWKHDRMHFTAKTNGFECTYTVLAWLSGLRGSWLSEDRQTSTVRYESGEFEFAHCDRMSWCEGLLPN